ncbi:MAG: hypothetical protein RIK87_23885 [Fuerstiella sp.]
MQKARHDEDRTGLHDMLHEWKPDGGLLAVANLGSHPTFLAANLATSFTCLLRSHSDYSSEIKNIGKTANREE